MGLIHVDLALDGFSWDGRSATARTSTPGSTSARRQEVIEAIIHCIARTGFPRVLNAVFVAKRVFEERVTTMRTGPA